MASSDSQTFSGFVTGDKRFEIPPYQRNYSWEKEQVNDLWSDLIEAVEMDRDHYIGTFLLMEDEREDETVLQVIDGQQRITTLIILLFELQERLDDCDANTTARMIRGEYIARYGTQKLTLAGDDEDFFEREILENISDDDRSGQNEVSVSDVDTDSPSQARLLETKRIFRNRLEDGVPDRLSYDDPAAFYTDLFEKVKSLPLLEYAVGSRSEAARIFQTVNDRGKDLTALEITNSLSECQVCCLRTIRLDKLGCSDIDFSVIPLISYCFCPPSVYTLSDVAHSSKSRSGFSTVTPTRFCAGATYSSFRSIPTNLLPRRLYEPSRPHASERVEDDSGRGRVGVTITRLLETIVSTARAVEIADVSPNIQGREYPSHSRYQ